MGISSEESHLGGEKFVRPPKLGDRFPPLAFDLRASGVAVTTYSR